MKMNGCFICPQCHNVVMVKDADNAACGFCSRVFHLTDGAVMTAEQVREAEAKMINKLFAIARTGETVAKLWGQDGVQEVVIGDSLLCRRSSRNLFKPRITEAGRVFLMNVHAESLRMSPLERPCTCADVPQSGCQKRYAQSECNKAGLNN